MASFPSYVMINDRLLRIANNGGAAAASTGISTTFDRRAARNTQTASMMQVHVEDWEVGIALANGELALGDTLGAMMKELAHDETGIADLECDVFDYINGSAGRAEMIRTVHASLGAALARLPRGTK